MISRHRCLRILLLYVLLVLTTGVLCFPLFWMLLTSVKHPSEIVTFPPTWIPSRVTLDHYIALFAGRRVYFDPSTQGQSIPVPQQHFLGWFANSVITSGTSTLITVIVSSMAAYAFQRLHVPGRRAIPYFSIIGYMVPPIVYVFPFFLIVVYLGLADHLSSLVLGYISITLPFSMWLMWSFIQGIPVELEQAALVDGASQFQAFVWIVLPLLLPAIIATSIFSFIVSWNDYLFARIFISTTSKETLTVGVMHFFEGVHVDWGLITAAAVLMTVPMAIVFMFVQRYLVAGFGAGGLKG